MGLDASYFESFLRGMAGDLPCGPVAVTINKLNVSHVNAAGRGAARVALTAQNRLAGGALLAGQYAFGVMDGDNRPVAVAVNGADGNIAFPGIGIAAPGDYCFTIRELTPSANGVACDNAVYGVDVCVTEGPNAGLSAQVAYQGGAPPVFTNYMQQVPAVPARRGWLRRWPCC